jgi:tagaturonate reductase
LPITSVFSNTVLNETILQFGTGKFLRAFADLFVHELNHAGPAFGKVVVVQSTGSERAEAFRRQRGRYHVAIRGLDAGRRMDHITEVRSVSRALAAASQWDDVLQVARSESLQTIISNTTEAGFATDPDDSPTDQPPGCFPAKLLTVLKARRDAGLPGVKILPCELLEANGSRLRDLVLEMAKRWELPASFVAWLQEECSWRNTLVDRIVSAPPARDPLASTDPLFAVAEPFALWLVEATDTPCGLSAHPAVQEVSDLAPYLLRKVRILNGAHTALVAKALPLDIHTVRQAVEDERIRPWLESLLFEEIVPVLAGRTDQPEQFARQTLERFANPFLEHRLTDIALHHHVKLQTRLAPTLAEFRERFGRNPTILGEILGSRE